MKTSVDFTGTLSSDSDISSTTGRCTAADVSWFPEPAADECAEVFGACGFEPRSEESVNDEFDDESRPFSDPELNSSSFLATLRAGAAKMRARPDEQLGPADPPTPDPGEGGEFCVFNVNPEVEVRDVEEAVNDGDEFSFAVVIIVTMKSSTRTLVEVRI